MEDILSYGTITWIFANNIFCAYHGSSLFLSRTGIKLLGFVVPVIVTIGFIYTYKTGLLHLNLIGTIILIAVTLLILAVEWENAQKIKRRNKFC